MNDTIFSSQEFVTAWCSHFGENLHPLKIAVGPPKDSKKDVFAVALAGRTRLKSVNFAPEGFYGSPGWEASPGETVAAVLSQLQGHGIRKFVWNVRYDHGAIAEILSERLSDVAQFSTRVLTLSDDLDRTFSGFNATIRNQIRKARKTGVEVREGSSSEDLQAYYAIHLRHVERRGGFDFVYPKAFLAQLIQPESAGRLLLATVAEKVVAGGIFLRDGNAVYYFHGAYDLDYSKQFPACAVIDAAIGWAHQIGAVAFNMGGSAGIEPLERFKSFWGAEAVQTWRFTWRNPLWSRLDSATRWLKNLAPSS
jgi:hypothetical protein